MGREKGGERKRRGKRERGEEKREGRRERKEGGMAKFLILCRWQLLQENSQRFGTVLKYMPAFMKRRKKNTSCFITREDLILWRVEWIFDYIFSPPGSRVPMVVDNAKVRGKEKEGGREGEKKEGEGRRREIVFCVSWSGFLILFFHRLGRVCRWSWIMLRLEGSGKEGGRRESEGGEREEDDIILWRGVDFDFFTAWVACADGCG
jgi:hypothetical protein